MSNPLMRTDIANAVTAGLDDVFWNSADDVPQQYEEIFGSETVDGQFYQALSFAGFGQIPKSGEGIGLTYDSPVEGFKANIEPDVYKLGCRITREAYDDERYGMLKKVPAELAKSFRYTKNVVVFNMLNNGFSASYTFADGSPLFGDTVTYAHTLKNGSLTYNRPQNAGVDLNKETLKGALIDLRRTLDDRGKLWNIGLLGMGVTLFVPLELQDTAYALANSEKDPETANNGLNWLKSVKINVAVGDFITDPDAWFVVATKKAHRIKVFNRTPLETDSDREFQTGCLLYSGYERYIAYPEDFRGIWVIPGA